MLKPGEKLSERYTVERILGQGGMGAVYLASMDALGGKKVAIKEMEHQGSRPEELASALDQFKTEATFLAHLDHPNLVQVTDFFVEADKHYLVMAYVPGETLQQKAVELGRPFQWEELRPWAESLCAVLTYLHTQDPPILFRDLKPSNIMVDLSGRLKLIDFGIARLGQAGMKTSTFLQGTGTSGFSPIEQYGGSGSTDERSDIYSLGATLYSLLTGIVPPDAVSRISKGAKVIPPSEIQPSLPSALDAILLKSMVQNPLDRYQTIAMMSRDLAKLSATPVMEDDAGTVDLRTAPAPAKPEQVVVTSPITVEMLPTGAAKNSKTSWVAIGSALSAACLVLVLIGSQAMPVSQESKLTDDVSKEPISSAISQSVTPASSAPPVAPKSSSSTQDGETMDSKKFSLPPTRVIQKKPPSPVTTTQPAATAQKPKPVVIVPSSIDASRSPYPKATPRTPTSSDPALVKYQPSVRPGPPPFDPRVSSAPDQPPSHLPPPPEGAPPPVQDAEGRWVPPHGGPPRAGGPQGGPPGAGPLRDPGGAEDSGFEGRPRGL